jgi:outer membrane lipoprotein
MKFQRHWTFLAPAVALCFLGCTHAISPQVRALAREDISLSQVALDPESFRGQMVIWGGVIVETENRTEGTTLTIMETPLGFEGIPEDLELSRGRFLARTQAFLDPAIYAPGRKVTLAGTIMGKEVRPVGEVPYTYPVVSIVEIHLWKEAPRVLAPPYPWYWGDPYWPWGWWWPRWRVYWGYY